MWVIPFLSLYIGIKYRANVRNGLEKVPALDGEFREAISRGENQNAKAQWRKSLQSLRNRRKASVPGVVSEMPGVVRETTGRHEIWGPGRDASGPPAQ